MSHDIEDPDNPHGDVTVDVLDLDAELSGDANAVASAEVAEYALWLGDDALILSQQLGKWIANAPELEEDVALGNIALDLLGHARSLLRYAGSATGKSEDDLAYWRGDREFRCVWMVQQDNGDFAQTIVRQFVMSTYMFALYNALSESTDPTLKAIAEKSVKEVEYHRDHAVRWVLRLAGGTEESRARLLRALTDLWPYVDELFRDETVSPALVAQGIVPLPSSLRAECDAVFTAVLAEEDVTVPEVPFSSAGGRLGNPFSTLGYILAGNAGVGPRASGCDMVTLDLERAREIAASVKDPEVPVLTIEDLGVLRDVAVEGERVVVTITPTYSGCPAMETIRDDLHLALEEAGFADVDINLTLSPAWTTDWMSDEGKRKLTEYGIAPPTGKAAVRGPIPLQLAVKCPRCGSLNTQELSRFGSTSCKSLWQCRACLEPFDHFKAL